MLSERSYFANVTIFDPATIEDKATYEQPTRLSVGVKYVFINGQLEFEDGRLTEAKAGKVLHGSGWKQPH